MELQAEKSWETGAQVAFLVPPPAHQPWQQPQTTRAPRRALLAQRAPPPLLVVPDVGIGGGAGEQPCPGRPGPVAPAQGNATRTDAHARSSRRPCCCLRRPQPPASGTREKSKQRRIGFCSIRGAGGGKSMFSKWEKRKSFRKDSLFPSRRGVRKQHRPLRRKHRGP